MNMATEKDALTGIGDDVICLESSSFSDVGSIEIEDDNMQTESPNIVTQKLEDFEPKIGMTFSSEHEAYEFYNEYAKVIGFTVRKHQYRRLANGTLRKRSFVCGREGHRRLKDPSHVSKVIRRETRTGCSAMILFTIENGIWTVSEFNYAHNHDLAKSSEGTMLRSKRHVNEAQVNVIEVMDNAGIKPSGTYSYLIEDAGGAQNVGFWKNDCNNFLREKRINTLAAGDTQSVINHFQRTQANDSSFFYTIQVDSENHMTNFFWRDGRSMIDYGHFGDVIIFDTTYRTNKYNMIFAPFVGVNHHRQSVLFGCAFLLYETIESFIWLFQSFLEAMCGHQPKTIFTAPCQAMADAIKRVFPESQHRLCLWHISENAPKHLAHYLRKPDFKVLFNRCLYNCETEQEFQDVWNQLLTKVDISKSLWLNKLYELRENWCPAFSKNYFSAGILCTKRSESMNNVFRKVTCKKMSLSHFVVQYEKVVECQRWLELQKDLESNQSAPPRVKNLAGMAKHAATIYTHDVFQEFYDELFESLSVAIEKTSDDGTFYSYKLVNDGDETQYNVTFESSNCMVECTCKKFESVGLLCLHALKVLNFHNIFYIPSQYILKRWTKEAKEGFGTIGNNKQASESATQSISFRMSQIMRKCSHFATKGALTIETTKVAEDYLENGIKSLERMLKETKFADACIGKNVEADTETDEEGNEDHNNELNSQKVLDPRHVKVKRVTNARHGQLEKKRQKKGMHNTGVGNLSLSSNRAKQNVT